MRDRSTAGGGNTDITRRTRDDRVSVRQGGIEFQHEGRPVAGGLPRTGLVYLVVDCSSSMEGQKLIQAKEGAINFAHEARAKGYSVGLITFASSATHICDPQQEAADLRGYLQAMVAGGSTKMAEGIQLATDKLRERAGNRVMVIVTDGKPDSREGALRAAQDAKSCGIDIITIGTDDADGALLRQLASRTGLSVMVPRDQLQRGITSTAQMLPEGKSQQHIR